MKNPELPEVGGRRLDISNEEFENRCKFYIALELEKLHSDNALIGVLSDGVRLCREYTDTMNTVVSSRQVGKTQSFINYTKR